MKTILVNAVRTLYIPGSGMYKDLYDLLEIYPNTKVIVTGATPTRMHMHGIINPPYAVFANETPAKNNPGYYNMMLQHFKLDPAQTVYIEKSPEAVKVAESLGIKSYLYDPEKKDLVAVKKFLDENL